MAALLQPKSTSAYEAVAIAAEMNSTRNLFLAQAVVGAGLACLRDKKE